MLLGKLVRAELQTRFGLELFGEALHHCIDVFLGDLFTVHEEGGIWSKRVLLCLLLWLELHIHLLVGLVQLWRKSGLYDCLIDWLDGTDVGLMGVVV